MTSSVVKVVIAAFFVVLVGLGVYAVVTHYRLRRWLQRHGVGTTGVVVRLEADTSDFDAAQFPVVQFHPSGQPPVEARYGVGHHPPAYAVGQTVRLLYDPAQPTRFVLGDESGHGQAWLLAVVLVATFAYGFARLLRFFE